MRSLLIGLMVALLFAAVAEAKLNPAFSVRVAVPGDTVELDVGPGTEQFLGELRIFLVSLEGDDRPQVKIGELGRRRVRPSADTALRGSGRAGGGVHRGDLGQGLPDWHVGERARRHQPASNDRGR